VIVIRVSRIDTEEGHVRRVVIQNDRGVPAAYEFKFVGNALVFVRGLQVALSLTGQEYTIEHTLGA
jgi:hypothetical protein